MTKNIFYFRRINAIGGIETFFYNLAQKYSNLDIVIYYNSGDEKQLRRLAKFVRVKKYNGEHIKCKKAFFNFNLDIIDNVEAEEYIQIAHGDYKTMGIKPNTHPKITKYLGVSQLVCDTYKEITGFDTELAYNPIIVEKPKKVLDLISATRLTKEKGKNRIIKLAKMLEKNNIPYIWTIFTDDVNAINNENVIFRKPRLDITDYIANADYLVQLSDNEGYCYSVVEALTVGTPVIVTDCPVFNEIGIEHGKNGFILDFDLNNVPIDAIYKGVKKFAYTPKEDTWRDLLEPGESQYKKDLKTLVKVKCIRNYFDLDMNQNVKKGDRYSVSKVRAETLADANYATMEKGGK